MTICVFRYLGDLEYISRTSEVSFIAHISGQIDLIQDKWNFFFFKGRNFFKIYFLFLFLFILSVPGLSCCVQDLRCGMQDLLVAAGGLLSCSMWTLSCGMHVGSSSLTRDQTQAPCIGSVESYPLDHQGNPQVELF